MENINFSYKYHIYKDNSTDAIPLCWDGAALEFDTSEEAERFISTMIMNREEDRDIFMNVVIRKDILYHKAFKDAGKKVLYYDNDGKEVLIEQ